MPTTAISSSRLALSGASDGAAIKRFASRAMQKSTPASTAPTRDRYMAQLSAKRASNLIVWTSLFRRNVAVASSPVSSPCDEPDDQAAVAEPVEHADAGEGNHGEDKIEKPRIGGKFLSRQRYDEVGEEQHVCRVPPGGLEVGLD